MTNTKITYSDRVFSFDKELVAQAGPCKGETICGVHYSKGYKTILRCGFQELNWHPGGNERFGIGNWRYVPAKLVWEHSEYFFRLTKSQRRKIGWKKDKTIWEGCRLSFALLNLAAKEIAKDVGLPEADIATMLRRAKRSKKTLVISNVKKETV